MSHFTQPVSTWIESLDRQITGAKHVLLHGNTADWALYSGMQAVSRTQSGCMAFESALHRYMVDTGFKLVLRFNIADGLQLVDPAMSETFQRVYASAMGGAQGHQYPTEPNIVGDAAGSLDAIRKLLQQVNVPCAVVMHFADKMISGNDHPHPEELPLLVRLRQAMDGASYASGQTALRNSLVIVTGRLTDIPAWIYVDNPRITLVQVNRPTARERRELIGARISDFYLARNVNPDQQKESTRDLADRTEGMSLFDISLLPRVSRTEEIPLSEAQSLVRASRYGKKEDPWKEIGFKRLESAAEMLSKRVKGQESAIAHVVTTLHMAHEGLTADSDRALGGRPKGIFFFVGPTGVGKTELAKSLAELVFGDEDRMKTFDMAEYQAEHAGDRLGGSPPGYVGFEQGGQLTNHVLAEPFSLILFDEMDKAHKTVNEKFLGILDEGRLTDGRGMTAYFDQTMLVFTSNIGSARLMERLRSNPNNQPKYEELRELYVKAVGEHFAIKFERPELLSRYGDNIIVFDMLRPELVAQLCDKFLSQLRDNALRQRQLDLQIDHVSIGAYLTGLMREPENLTLGGRRVRELINTVVVKPLNSYLFTNKPAFGTRLRLSVSGISGRITIS